MTETKEQRKSQSGTIHIQNSNAKPNEKRKSKLRKHNEFKSYGKGKIQFNQYHRIE